MLRKFRKTFTSAIAVCGLASTSASATFLTPGQSLSAGQSLLSHDGRHAAVMQADGNLVVYRLADNKAMWSTNTTGSGAVLAAMQTDGNFVLYTAANQPVWSTGTWQSGPQPNQFTVDDDGTAVVVTYAPVWGTGTGVAGNAPGPAVEFKYGDNFTPGQMYSAANGYQWVFQTDGNLVLYRNGSSIWATNKLGGKYARFDGNLTVFRDGRYSDYTSPAGQPPTGLIYQTGSLTLNADSSHFVIQSDGNAVIYKAFRVWGSSPAGRPPVAGTFEYTYLSDLAQGIDANTATQVAISKIKLACDRYNSGTLTGIPMTDIKQNPKGTNGVTAGVSARCEYIKPY